MNKTMFSLLLLVILFNVSAVSVYATSVAVETSISQNFHVVFTFSNINATTYENITSNGLMTANTLPSQLLSSMIQKGLSDVDYSSTSISFNSTTYSIVSAFNLQGSSIITSTINHAASIETFYMNTAWREFYLNVTNNFQFNFTQDFAETLSSWTSETVGGITSYSYSNSTAQGTFSFSFQLPSNASNISVVGDTITFEIPYENSFADNLISSPILILIVLAVAGVIVYVYRRSK